MAAGAVLLSASAATVAASPAPTERDAVQAVATAVLAPRVEGDCAACWDDLTAAWRMAPDTPGLARAMLREAMVRGDWRTVDAVAAQVSDAGGPPDPITALALLSRMVERNDRAGLERMVAAGSDAAGLLTTLSRVTAQALARDRGDGDDALAVAGAKGRPTTSQRLLVALARTDRGNVDGAVRALDGVTAVAGGDAVLLARLVDAWRRGEHQGAIDGLSASLRNNLISLDLVRHAPAVSLPRTRNQVALVLSNALLAAQVVSGDSRDVLTLRALMLRAALRMAPDDRLIVLSLGDVLARLERPDLIATLPVLSAGPDANVQLAERMAGSGSDLKVAELLRGARDWPLESRIRALDVLRQAGEWSAQIEVARSLRDDPLVAHPNFAPLRRALWLEEAQARIRLDDWPRARDTLEQALAAMPDDPTVLNFAGYAALERREGLATAVARIEKAAAAAPDNSSITDSLGWAYVVTGDAARGVPLLERASRADDGNAVIAEHLGDALWLAGRRIEAQQAWKRAHWTVESETDGARIARKLAQGYRPDAMAP